MEGYKGERVYEKKIELKPWRKQGLVIPPMQNGDFVANMEKILEANKRPYDPRFPVVCIDELPNKAQPGRLEKYDYEYICTKHSRLKLQKKIWDRFEFLFTPKHGSWLNMAEIELNVLMGQCLNRRLGNIDKIKSESQAWETARNNKEVKINWQFETDDARIKLKILYPTFDS